MENKEKKETKSQNQENNTEKGAEQAPSTAAVDMKGATLRERILATKLTRWIRFGIVMALFIAWVAWLGNWWVALFGLLLFDIYITGYIPFTWWKRTKNKAVYRIMSWVDAIVYALILVYFVFNFVGQNYMIPSSSLEKTLLVGDYLVVNKMAYGPRVPMTPIHFPLVHNTFPILNTKSYADWPEWRYHRLEGFGNVERGDIVVFNFPAGDTVALKMQNPDFYTLCRMIGRDQILANPSKYGEVVYRPVDRRENYVKRTVGLPGERLSIRDGVIYINGEPMAQPENVQFNYFVQMKGAQPITDEQFDALGISNDDRWNVRFNPDEAMQVNQYTNGVMPALTHKELLRQEGFTVDNINGIIPFIYRLTLTPAMVEQLKAMPGFDKMVKEPDLEGDFLFPFGVADKYGWTRADYGEIWIPKKGATLKLTPENWEVYERCIRNYEHHPEAYFDKAKGVAMIDGKPTEYYTFQLDYYFMMGDNRDNSLDSRYWGFVPEDHIVGRPEVVLISFDKDKGMLSGGIRWNRIFKRANPDK